MRTVNLSGYLCCSIKHGITINKKHQNKISKNEVVKESDSHHFYDQESRLRGIDAEGKVGRSKVTGGDDMETIYLIGA